MDGKGSWRDNVFVERLWKSVKHEEVYLHAYDSVGQARQGPPNLCPAIEMIDQPSACFIFPKDSRTLRVHLIPA